MKVLYLTGMYPTPKFPQKGIFCHEQVKSLKKIGVDVDVVVPMTMYDKEYVKEWFYEGVKIRYIKFFKFPGAKFFEYTGYFLYLALKFSNIDLKSYDIIHADSPLPTGDAASYLSKKFNIPFVVHVHGLDAFFNESYAEQSNCEKIYKRSKNVYIQANAIISVSNVAQKKVTNKLKVIDKCYVVYNGVDVDDFKPSSKRNNSVITIIDIGNLIWLKGHEYVIEAMEILERKYPGRFFLKILGRGPLEEKLKEMVDKKGLDKIVVFKGYIPYSDVREELQKSDIFVLPSFYEALGCVYLEAMACSLPVIGCQNNGISEVIENDVDGFLVNEKCTDDIVNVIEKLMDEDYREKVGKYARKKVTNNYTWNDSAKNLLNIYKNVLEKGKY